MNTKIKTKSDFFKEIQKITKEAIDKEKENEKEKLKKFYSIVEKHILCCAGKGQKFYICEFTSEVFGSYKLDENIKNKLIKYFENLGFYCEYISEESFRISWY